MGSPIGDMVVRIVGDNDPLDNALTKSEKKYKAFADSLSKMGGKLTTFVSVPLLGIGAAALKSASAMEDQLTSFEVMLGSAEKAKALLADLRDLAAHTPFELTDLTDATKTLLQFGIAGEDVIPITKMLGDVAQGNSAKFNSLALVFGQVQSTGRLMGQDLLQMINVGFNPLKVISDATGESMASLKEKMSEGAISAEDVANAFKIATSEGGLFYQGMEKASQTLSGRFSTLKDNVTELARGFGELLLPEAKKLVETASDLVAKYSALSDEQRQQIIQTAKVVIVIGPLVLAIGKLASMAIAAKKAIIAMNLATLTNPYVVAAAAIVALGTAVFQLTKNFRQEERERDRLLAKQKSGVELSEEERMTLAKVEMARLQSNRALAQETLLKAQSVNQSPQMIAALQQNISNIETEIALKAQQLRSIGDDIQARRKAAEAIGEQTESEEDLIDAMTNVSSSAAESGETITESNESILESMEIRNAGILDMLTEEEIANAEAAKWIKDARLESLKQISAAEQAAHDKELANIESLKTAAETIYSSLQDFVTSYFEYKLSLYEEDSEEYKEEAEKQWKWQQAFSASQAAIAGFEGAIKAYNALAGIPVVGPFLGAAAAIAIGSFAAAQVVSILSEEMPALAEGGIISPTSGGTPVIVGEGKEPEIVSPLSEFSDLLAQYNSVIGGGESSEGNISLVVNLDSKPFLETIFPATRDKRILISSGAVV